MEKKYQIIYIWSFIILACFILLLLYTPVGGRLNQPSTKVYTTMNKSVHFNGAIANSPRIKSSNQSVSSENEIPVASNLPNYKQKSNSYQKATRSQSAYDYSVVSQTVETSKTSSEMSGGLAVIGSRGGNATNSNNVYSENLNQPFSEQSVGSQMQKAPPPPPGDPHDPGGDPTGNPLPVGDGLTILFALAVLYTIFIYRKRLSVS